MPRNPSNFQENLVEKGDPRKAIGVFDSGIGGLTVVRQIHRILPHESTVYFGDTARVPYGPKSEKLVRRFALQNSQFLLEEGIKAIVIACNTASSVALQTVQEHMPVPVMGVIEPGVKAAVQTTKTGKIGVIGTVGTIESEAYHQAIRRHGSTFKVFGQACPLFVPLAEEGWVDRRPTLLIAEAYLTPLKKQNIDTLILGCTHYPLLKLVISKVMGPDITLIDSAEETARELRALLQKRELLRRHREDARRTYYVSDVPHRFREVAERFLGNSLGSVERVDIEKYENPKKDIL
ncbi:MAG: glutamate racemase [Gemmatimonadota bacterium]|nr:MAG: glutamate racemase [Gemmatimonadota bacterium]